MRTSTPMEACMVVELPWKVSVFLERLLVSLRRKYVLPNWDGVFMLTL